MKKKAIKIIFIIVLSVFIVFFCGCSDIKEALGDADEISDIAGSRSNSVNILLLLTILSLLPSILIMLTSFTRIIIVLSLIRNGLGLQQMPPNQVLIGLALFLTFFTMSPVIDDIKVNAYQPYIEEKITEDEFFTEAMKPIREFMFRQTYKSDLQFFLSASGGTASVESLDEVKNSQLIPAFMTSELKRGFQIGFFIYLPFIVIDMIVSSTLMSMGMMMLPPIVISLPFKLLLFVLVDGWALTVQTVINSFG